MTRKFRSVHPEEVPAQNEESKTDHSPSRALHPLYAAILVSIAATAASLVLPEAHASSGVAFVFLGATYFLCLRRHHQPGPAHYGLALGGLLDADTLSFRRMFRETLRALLLATALAAIVFPAFWIGFLFWFTPGSQFDLGHAFTWEKQASPGLWLREMLLWHLLAVALPEEAFFRGYLQTALDDRGYRSLRIAGRRYGTAILLVSLIFALGHFATEPHPARLAVFFPSLLFGILRTASGGIGAAIFFHAFCNLFSQWLGQGYGLY